MTGTNKEQSDLRPEVAPSVARHVYTGLLANVALPLSTAVTAVILARGLGPIGRGQVASASGPFLLVLAAGALGIPEAATFFVARGAQGKHFIRLLVSAGIFASLGSALALATLGFLLTSNLNIRYCILFSALTIGPSVAVAILRGTAQGRNEWHAVLVERWIVAVCRFGGVIASLEFLRGAAWAVGGALVLAPVPGVLAYFPPLRRRAPAARPSAEPQRSEMLSARDVFSYGSQAWIGSLSGVLIGRLDQVLMIALTTSSELGVYALAVNVADIPLLIISSAIGVAVSVNASRMDLTQLALMSRITTAVTAVACLVLCLTLWIWLPLLVGGGFGRAIAPAELLLGGVMLSVPGSFAGACLTAAGRPGLRSKSLFLACLGNAVMVVAIVPSMGAIGASVATVAAGVIANALNMRYVRRLYGVRIGDLALLRMRDVRNLVARRVAR